MEHTKETYHHSEGFSLFIRENPFDVDRKTIIFIHGIGVSGRYFLPLFTEMAKHYNVIAIDFPGYGNAPKPPRPLSIRALSLLLERFLIEQNISKPILIGHSMGCQIIADVLKRRSDIVSKAILIAPTINRHERTFFRQSLRLAQDTFRESFTANKTIFGDYLKMGIFRYLRSTRYMLADSIEDSLHNIQTPTLLVRGSRDVIVPRRWLQDLASHSRHLSTAEIPNAPHAVHFDFAREVASVCDDFLKT